MLEYSYDKWGTLPASPHLLMIADADAEDVNDVDDDDNEEL